METTQNTTAETTNGAAGAPVPETPAPAPAPAKAGLTVSRGSMQVKRSEDPEGTTFEVLPSGATKVTLPNGRVQIRAPQSAGFLSKQQIATADDLTYEDVEVPEWTDGSSAWVRIYALTAHERGKIENAQITIKDDGATKWDGSRMRELFVAYALRDPNSGVRLFNDKEIHVLGAKSSAALDRLYEVATRLSRVSKKDLDEMAGKLDSDPSDVSHGGTGSE